MIAAVVWAIAGLLALFSIAGVAVVVREAVALRKSGRQPATLSLRQRFNRYVGPINRSAAPLTPPARVAVEFGAALCGFPGLGWMISGRLQVGLPLIIAVPAMLWAFFPLFISLSGHVFDEPMAVFAVLPAIAVLSSALLAVQERAQTQRT